MGTEEGGVNEKPERGISGDGAGLMIKDGTSWWSRRATWSRKNSASSPSTRENQRAHPYLRPPRRVIIIEIKQTEHVLETLTLFLGRKMLKARIVAAYIHIPGKMNT